eukprot:scaffold49275_cov36-Prasinocladus_malaysianus.AAC.1
MRGRRMTKVRQVRAHVGIKGNGAADIKLAQEVTKASDEDMESIEKWDVGACSPPRPNFDVVPKTCNLALVLARLYCKVPPVEWMADAHAFTDAAGLFKMKNVRPGRHHNLPSLDTLYIRG